MPRTTERLIQTLETVNAIAVLSCAAKPLARLRKQSELINTCAAALAPACLAAATVSGGDKP
jgi:hypothetical protein